MTQHTPIHIDCTFTPDGRIYIRRLKLTDDGRWQPAEQGRQWADETGRHILIMLHGRAHQLTLSAQTLQWQLHELHSGQVAV